MSKIETLAEIKNRQQRLDSEFNEIREKIKISLGIITVELFKIDNYFKEQKERGQNVN